MSQTYVALDLETTGLDAESDAIIEVGAVRFSLAEKLGEFSTLVNPRRKLSAVVQRLTGIDESELAAAPPLEVVASDVEEFLAESILVGHNACGFDAPVLDANGIRRPASIYDTQPLAETLFPTLSNYGLADLTTALGIEFTGHHRALADAEASRRVFLALMQRSLELPAETISQIGQWLTPTELPWRGFFREAWDLRQSRGASHERRRSFAAEPLTPIRPARRDAVDVPAEEPLSVLASAAERSDVFEAFEERPQQAEMLRGVAGCLNERSRLMVEAGTGTGKSLAYLLPAAMNAVANGTRVVVSTSTINLQEQLARKDVPAVQALLGSKAPAACQLKGRRNYLCMRRFHALQSTAPESDAEAMLASRILVWLGETETGDRGEIRISPEEERYWARLSAEGADCSSDNSPFVVDGSCFLANARKRAEASHVVVVNHSLLLSDAAIGGMVLPPFQHLVIDEGHRLEDEASRQFGFTCKQKDIEGLPDRCRSLVSSITAAAKARPFAAPQAAQIGAAASAVREAAKPVKGHLATFYDVLSGFVGEHAARGEESRLHLTRASRAQPRWSDVEIAWSNARESLGQLAGVLGKLVDELTSVEGAGPPNLDLIVSDALGCGAEARELPAGISVAVEKDDPQRITWLEIDPTDGGTTVSWVPLDVAGRLQDAVYHDERSVIVTGATLRSGGDFGYLQRRLGLAGCETLGLDSPFDHARQSMVIVSRDLPDPNDAGHIDAVSNAVVDLARASGGRALVLFTANSALRAVRGFVSEELQRAGITVLGQGIDGSPRQLVRALQSDPATVLLGTASFWEGVDIPGDALSLLVIARLPFPVPTDPVHSARSEQYEDPFAEYMVPQAAIRFKQGFGRLIRSRTDRGVAVVLDPRMATRAYGEVFLKSLPRAPVREMPVRDMAAAVETFLASPAVLR